MAGLMTLPAHAETPAPDVEATEVMDEGPDIGEQTRATLLKFAQFLTSKQSFSYTAVMGYQAVQEAGFRLEFGSTKKLTVKRPDRARVESQNRNGDKRLIVIDGKEIAVFDETAQVYAIVPKEGTLSEVIDYFVDDLQMPLPMAELVSDDLAEVLTEQINFAHTVDESTIAGVLCDNIIIQNDEVDAQLWIEKGEQPLLRRVVITYRNAPGEPQFWAQFQEWDFTPDVGDEKFTFNPPADANRIIFAPAMLAVVPGGEEQ